MIGGADQERVKNTVTDDKCIPIAVIGLSPERKRRSPAKKGTQHSIKKMMNLWKDTHPGIHLTVVCAKQKGKYKPDASGFDIGLGLKFIFIIIHNTFLLCEC